MNNQKVSSGEVAIFWDYENVRVVAKGINVPLAESILERAEEYGHIRAKRAYSNWRGVSDAIVQALYSLGFEPIQVSMGKANSVDVKLAVDCLDVVMSIPNITHVFIVTGDKDFIPVVNWLQSRQKIVIVIGKADVVSDHLILSADKFISLEELSKEHQTRMASPSLVPSKRGMTFDEGVQNLVMTISKARDLGKSTRFAMIDNLMRSNLDSGYNGSSSIQKPDNSGFFPNFTSFINAAEDAGKVKTKTIEGFTEIFLKEEDPDQESEFSSVLSDKIEEKHWNLIFDEITTLFAEKKPEYPGHRFVYIFNRLRLEKKAGLLPYSNHVLNDAVSRLVEIGVLIHQPDEFYLLSENFQTNREAFLKKIIED